MLPLWRLSATRVKKKALILSTIPQPLPMIYSTLLWQRWRCTVMMVLLPIWFNIVMCAILVRSAPSTSIFYPTPMLRFFFFPPLTQFTYPIRCFNSNRSSSSDSGFYHWLYLLYHGYTASAFSPYSLMCKSIHPEYSDKYPAPIGTTNTFRLQPSDTHTHTQTGG